MSIAERSAEVGDFLKVAVETLPASDLPSFDLFVQKPDSGPMMLYRDEVDPGNWTTGFVTI